MPILWDGIFSIVQLVPTEPVPANITCLAPLSPGVNDAWVKVYTPVVYTPVVYTPEVVTHPSLMNNRIVYQITGQSDRKT